MANEMTTVLTSRNETLSYIDINMRVLFQSLWYVKVLV